ncbi:hypothetical protein GJ496_010550 [Pomphorhynchus laevis]|nr:hypothetical protein GJ496_010550 [Pomphorhynchus laevis]
MSSPKEENQSKPDICIIDQRRSDLTDYQLKKARYFFNVNLDIENKGYITWEDVEFYILFHMTATGRESDATLEKTILEKSRVIWDKIKNSYTKDVDNHLTIDQFLDTWACLRDYINKYDDIPVWLKEWIEVGFKLYDTEDTGSLKPSIFYALYSKMGLNRIYPAIAFRALTKANIESLNLENVIMLTKRLVVSDDQEDESRFLLPGFEPNELAESIEEDLSSSDRKSEHTATKMPEYPIRENLNDFAFPYDTRYFGGKENIDSRNPPRPPPNIKLHHEELQKNHFDMRTQMKTQHQQQILNNPDHHFNEELRQFDNPTFINNYIPSANSSFKNRKPPAYEFASTVLDAKANQGIHTNNASFRRGPTSHYDNSKTTNFSNKFTKPPDHNVICEILSEMNINPSECELLVHSNDGVRQSLPIGINNHVSNRYGEISNHPNCHWQKINHIRPAANNQFEFPNNFVGNEAQRSSMPDHNRFSNNDQRQKFFRRNEVYNPRPRIFRRNENFQSRNRFNSGQTSIRGLDILDDTTTMTPHLQNHYASPNRPAQPQQLYHDNSMNKQRPIHGEQYNKLFANLNQIPIYKAAENNQLPINFADYQQANLHSEAIVNEVIHRIKPTIQEIVREELRIYEEQRQHKAPRNVANTMTPNTARGEGNYFQSSPPRMERQERPVAPNPKDHMHDIRFSKGKMSNDTLRNNQHYPFFNIEHDAPLRKDEARQSTNYTHNKRDNTSEVGHGKKTADNTDEDDEFWRGESGQSPSINKMIFDRLLQRQLNKQNTENEPEQQKDNDSTHQNKQNETLKDTTSSHTSQTRSESASQISELEENDEMIFIPGMGGFGTFVPLNIDPGFMHNPGFNQIPFDSFMMSMDKSEIDNKSGDKCRRQKHNRNGEVYVVIDDDQRNSADNESSASSVLEAAN